MHIKPIWLSSLSDFQGSHHPEVLSSGSLTNTLLQTGQPFSVVLQALTEQRALEHEIQSLGLTTTESMVFARLVHLKLSENTVVIARSACRPHCPVWGTILDRGSRSLGFSLFDADNKINKSALFLGQITPATALYQACVTPLCQDPLPARYRVFTMNQAPLVVCEIFLPSFNQLVQA